MASMYDMPGFLDCAGQRAAAPHLVRPVRILAGRQIGFGNIVTGSWRRKHGAVRAPGTVVDR